MRRQHTAAFKFEIVRQLQTGERRLAQLCREHELDPTMVRGWCARVEKHGTQAFPGSPAGNAAVGESACTALTLAAAEARIADLERLVGQLTLENDFLKKALRQAGCPSSNGKR
jgi:transposase-like protein